VTNWIGLGTVHSMSPADSLETMNDQQPLGLILLRQLASYLTVPMWIMDHDGNLLYYNDAAEGLLGVRFDDAGAISAEDLASRFEVTDPTARHSLQTGCRWSELCATGSPLMLSSGIGRWMGSHISWKSLLFRSQVRATGSWAS